jgi:hypothetical protein
VFKAEFPDWYFMVGSFLDGLQDGLQDGRSNEIKHYTPFHPLKLAFHVHHCSYDMQPGASVRVMLDI